MRARDRAYAQLREDILDGLLAPGAVLAEVEQGLRLGMSRTPVREALARLVADGLVEPLAGRGLVVSALSAAGVRELYELREALERQAVRLAATRGEPAAFTALAVRFADAPALLGAGEDGLRRYYDLVGDFDAALDAAVANSYLVQALAGVRLHLARVRRLARHDRERLVEAAGEHRLIAEAVAAGDAALAASAVRVHLHHSRTRFLRAVAGGDAPAGPPVPGPLPTAPQEATS